VRCKQRAGIGRVWMLAAKLAGASLCLTLVQCQARLKNAMVRLGCAVVWRVNWTVCQQIDASVPL
jgi:hypothetical protein